MGNERYGGNGDGRGKEAWSGSGSAGEKEVVGGEQECSLATLLVM